MAKLLAINIYQNIKYNNSGFIQKISQMLG